MARSSLKNVEIWSDIAGYEGFYQVSNFGRVKSLYRVAGTPFKKYTCKEKILKCRRDTKGYNWVCLFKNGVCKEFKVARLVAFAFIVNPDPDNLYLVNHLDEDVHNDRADNLEWSNHVLNARHGTCQERIRQKRLGTHHSENTRLKMSSMRKGKLNGNYGHKWTDEQKQKASERLKRLYAERRNSNG